MKITSLLLVFLLLSAFGIVGAQETLESCLATPNENGCRAGLSAARYQLLLDEMTLHPDPNVQPIPPNDIELSRYAFRKLVNPNGTTLYDGPNGAAIGHLDAGFNFVSVMGYQEGWVQINNGQWVVESDAVSSRPSTFAGVLLPPEGLKYPIAWVVKAVYPAPYPGAEGDQMRPALNRYTRVNIFDSVEVDGWRWYLVGPDTWIKQVFVGKVLFTERPEGVKGRWVSVDLYEQVLVAYDEENRPTYATLISSGLPQWSTNEGVFQSWVRIASGKMSGAEGQTDFYSLENVPWTLYFDNAISLHGAYWHDGFGYRRSHGCVNMSLTDSAWLYHWTLDGGYDLPWVVVYSSGDYIK